MRVYMAARDAGRDRFTSAIWLRLFRRTRWPNLSKSLANPDLEQGVLRSLQAEMIAQCRPLIVGAEQASLLQNRHHEPHEILKTFVEIRRPHVEAVRRVILEPLLQGVGDAFGRAAQHPMAARCRGEAVEIAQRHRLAPRLCT